MVKINKQTRFDKYLVRIPMMKDTSEPYNHHVIELANRVFRRNAPSMGNVDWGPIEFLCYAFQVEELYDVFVQAGKFEFFRDHIELKKLDVWPKYPINATGDETLLGIDCPTSYPNLIADQIKELKTLTKKVDALKKAYHLLTGETYGTKKMSS